MAKAEQQYVENVTYPIPPSGQDFRTRRREAQYNETCSPHINDNEKKS